LMLGGNWHFSRREYSQIGVFIDWYRKSLRLAVSIFNLFAFISFCRLSNALPLISEMKKRRDAFYCMPLRSNYGVKIHFFFTFQFHVLCEEEEVLNLVWNLSRWILEGGTLAIFINLNWKLWWKLNEKVYVWFKKNHKLQPLASKNKIIRKTRWGASEENWYEYYFILLYLMKCSWRYDDIMAMCVLLTWKI
jgi:hypothetical protein